MGLIGIRELRENTSEVLRKVREEKAEYVITYQGRPVAIILPVDEEAVENAIMETGKQTAVGSWEAYRRIIDELRAEWPAEVDTQSLLDEIRGD